ncbi:hypothetical protein ABZ348_02925 [Streptomyces sp. NPDC005963]|uniref:WD40 repeat domain-containing protein n=1 Tax=Streptomyces sp. NPDC005963 TaxID=3156721 RepID=UPI0033C0EA5C
MGPVFGVTFSPDGSLLTKASADETVRLWDPASGHPIDERIAGHTPLVFSTTFSPDDTLLATAGADTTVRLHLLAPHVEI